MKKKTPLLSAPQETFLDTSGPGVPPLFDRRWVAQHVSGSSSHSYSLPDQCKTPAGLQHLFYLLTTSCPSAFTVASLPTIPADTLLLQRSWCIELCRSHIWLDSTHTVAGLIPCGMCKSLLSCTPPARSELQGRISEHPTYPTVGSRTHDVTTIK